MSIQKLAGVVVAFISVCVFVTSCTKGRTTEVEPEDPLVGMVRRKGIYDYLVTWTDDNITPRRLTKADLELEGGTEKHPSYYRANIPFNWDKFRLPGSWVTIVCDEKGDWAQVRYGSLRSGIIVSLTKEPVNDIFIIYRDRRIAVYRSDD